MSVTDVVRASLGTVLVLRPGLPMGPPGAAPTRTSDAVARLLGARCLAQAVVGATVGRRSPARRRAVRRADAGVEALHAASMVLLAVAAPRWARPALMSAGVASGLAVLDARAARNTTRAR